MTTDVAGTIAAFNAAWNDHDLEAALALVAEDAVFESTGPAPDGERHTGREALRAAWQPIFDDASSRFDSEELLVSGGEVVQRWIYSFDGGHVRGVDVMTVANGLVTRKLSYVKG